MRILVIEDEPRTLTFVGRALQAQGMTVATAQDGASGLASALTGTHDLVILDLLLPELNGLELLKRLRSRKPDLPVLILSARADLETKLRGFDLGATDYLVKPFSLDELIARVWVQLRRGQPTDERQVMRAGLIELDVARREARSEAGVSRLTDIEFRLLHHLAGRPGEVVSREQLLAAVWGYDFDPRSNIVDVCVRRLRKKLGPDAPIETVRNVGYRLLAA
jgi:two-component system, OmpR family, response regulator